MRPIYFTLIALIFFSCRNAAEKEQEETTSEAPEPKMTASTKNYTSQKWHFSAEIPEGFEIFEGELPGESPVINFFDPEIEEEPPFAIHNDAEDAYIAVLPKGFGVDAPGGPRRSFKEWKGDLPLSFQADPESSYAYLLENGEPWAISVRFQTPPPGWNEYGSIYVFYEVNNFRAECFSSNTGEEVDMKECNPMEGDAMKFYGEVSEEKRSALNDILESLYFTDPNRERREIEELIKVEQPQENSTVSSPLKISGKARGYWFFEASAPVRLVSESGKVLAEKYISATDDWMTEDWVPFEAELEFKTKEKRGYLIFNRANASGKPEHDRVMRIPVVFN
ncbi:Immunoglobulin-like domain of spore germination [Salinimicrobium sediminis]|uniref:Immunoglobulin-like domain of spore germination n=1 Tax=Salinimicrobium sediminis TaxID=1343891 RepID=A0A285WZX2_9FLAO|nr:Gmad2 immunoglobulin-like domain-containing protein [Salinimicrobium sediminis]SOC78633.1 Immunoglobulin-like domain of spore germination [Salinimicrobium sediminis]